MKLAWIADMLIPEGAGQVLKPLLGARYKQLKKSLGFMPKKKVKHSLRVGATAAQAGLSPEDVEAAILHDYIERGGDPAKLDKLHIAPRARRIIDMLSITEKTPGADDTADVQHHIEQMLADPAISPHDKNIAIIVKSADRIDNLRKRIKQNKLTPQYAEASLRLLQTLAQAFTGDPAQMAHIRREITKLGVF
jgi:(p)ppGpp synthase/HD superfamily hydrolase